MTIQKANEAKRRMTISVVDDFFDSDIVLPPLYLQINPQNMQKDYRKKISRFQSFSAHIEQYWGEELDTIAVSNTTGGFYTPETGITSLHKRESEAFQNFQSILDLYKRNGNTYDEVGRVVNKGSVILSFNPDDYWGYFESFDWAEDANTPFRFNFSFTFKVERTYTGF